ncbi:MAG: GTPase HflX [Desulfurococcaceae archaeon]
MSNVAVVLPYKYREFYDEELSLVKTIYNKIVDVFYVKKPNPKTYVQLNKLPELKNSSVDKIIVMDRLKPTQLINIVRETGKEVVDRILLILEIFSLHAGSLEAKLQIELARLKHQLPLIREAIRYAKIGELHGYLGAGRYGYENYYTMLKKREKRIRKKIEDIRRARNIHRSRRIREGYFHIAIVGYTCAGKTTLFNKLTNLNKPVGPEPFTTLSPKTSRVFIDGVESIIVDTVGFIRDLPHEIIEAFYATLEEIKYSNVIIHIVDASKPVSRVISDYSEAKRILLKIGIHGKPTIIALNKIDLLNENNLDELVKTMSKYIDSNELLIPISAEKEVNLDKLIYVLKKILVTT